MLRERERTRETEGGREWRWMERHWIIGEGQAGFTMGCHGSRIMLGSLPWEKLQDEGQRLQSVVTKHCPKISTLAISYHYISIYCTLPWGGKWIESPPGESVYSTHACLNSTVMLICLLSMQSHKGNNKWATIMGQWDNVRDGDNSWESGWPCARLYTHVWVHSPYHNI